MSASRSLSLRIPKDRVGVLIGKGGAAKAKLEEGCGVKVKVNGNTGDVEVEPGEGEGADPSLAAMVAEAIGYGFSFERAFRLCEEPGAVLSVVDLRDYAGHSRDDLRRIKGRIIGEGGKARRLIEELTGAYVSVYGRFVAIIGDPGQAELAEEAVRMLASGSMHKTVYEMLQRQRAAAKLERMKLWEDRAAGEGST